MYTFDQMPVSLQVYSYRSMNYIFSNNTSTKIPTNQESKKRNCKLPVKLNDTSTLGQVFDFRVCVCICIKLTKVLSLWQSKNLCNRLCFLLDSVHCLPLLNLCSWKLKWSDLSSHRVILRVKEEIHEKVS